MAHPFSDCPSRLRCSFKTATALVCACNVLAALFVLRSLVSPLALFSSSSSSSSSYPSLGVVLQPRRSPLRAVRYNEEQLNRIKEAVEAWKAAEPVELIKRVKEIQLESAAGLLRMKQAEAAREKVASDLTQRLKELREAGNQSDQQALEEWRRKKLAEAKMREEAAKTEQKELKAAADAQAADEVIKVLEIGWSSLLEDLGLSEPQNDPAMENKDGMSHDNTDTEDGIIPGRPLPLECHAEPHTDYGGAAVRWGLTHHKESAADCCQACLDQARAAKPGEMKCNIWVYCPAEGGCFSPDKYEHKHQECWLKQASEPQLNFKGKYDPEYRRTHPTAPVVVPWASGVISL